MAEPLAVGRRSAAVTGRPGSRRRWEVIHRPIPHGLVHWRYLTARPPDALARQRCLWLAARHGPRPLWWALELYLYLKWQLWRGPASVWRAVRGLGPAVRNEEGIGLLAQGWAVARLSLSYCLPPYEIYRYRLYRAKNRAQVVTLVYDQTLAAFHRGRNDPGDATRQSLFLLGDKELLTAELSSAGVPMAPILTVARRGSGTPLASLVSEGEAVFCKPRHGSGGRGAFTARLSGRVLTVDAVDGSRYSGAAAEAYWSRLLQDDDMVVQPRLSAHPDVGDLATVDDIVTVRYITERVSPATGDGTGIRCYCATLELPCGTDRMSPWPSYVIVEVDPDSGDILGFPEEYLRGEDIVEYRRVLTQAGHRRVPAMDCIRQASQIAHHSCPGVHAIAWDWAITPDGPLLLEGNSGWAVDTPQQLKGGLLTPR